jgi:ligand-binding sensor domain-containing protein
VEDGLPQNFISGIIQDKDGFLWIGTRDGLARYDGRHFIVFRHQYNDSASLSSSVIAALVLDKQNLLWIVYDNNYLDCFDPRTFRILKRQDRNSTAVKLAKKFVEPDIYRFNDEWYISARTPCKGIAVFDFDNDKYSLYNRSNGYLASDTVLAFTHDSSGNLWLASTMGLQTTDRSREKFQTIPFPNTIKLKYDLTLHLAMMLI